MSATDNMKTGDSLPRIVSVRALEHLYVAVRWHGTGQTKEAVVDLAPAILAYKYYKPLRDNPALFASVQVSDDGAELIWGDTDPIEMPATTVERLAEETMQTSDFQDFLMKNSLTYDQAAAELGISRRLVAYYAAGKQIPRYIALACQQIAYKLKSGRTDAPRGNRSEDQHRIIVNKLSSYADEISSGSWNRLALTTPMKEIAAHEKPEDMRLEDTPYRRLRH